MLIKLIQEQFYNFKLAVMPIVMLAVMSTTTFLRPESFTFSGICIVFMLFFSQIKNQMCSSEDCTAQQYMTSRYLFYLILMHISLAWLCTLMWFNSLMTNTLFFTNELLLTVFVAYCIDIALISLVVPLSMLLDQQATGIISVMTIIIGVSAMMLIRALIATQALTIALFPAMITFPITIFAFSLLSFRKVFEKRSTC